MMVTQENFERIEEYLQGTLPAAAHAAFEREINANETLAQEVALHRQLALSVGNAAETAMEALLQQVVAENRNAAGVEGLTPAALPPEEEEETKTVRLTPFKSVYMRVAAMLLLAIAATMVYVTQFAPTDYQALYAEAMVSYESPDVVRGAEGTNPLFNQAYDLYLKGEFEKAITVFEELLGQDPENHNAKLFMGICYLQVDRPEEALGTLDGIDDFQLADKTQYYKALAHLRQENVEVCTELLDDLVANHTGRYAKAAESLLNKLR